MNDETKLALKALEIFRARYPRPAHVTIKQAAEMLGKSRNTISKMLHTGQP